MSEVPRHKVFVSFHHEDEDYKKLLEDLYADQFVSRSVGDGDIDPNLNTEYIRQKIRDKFIADATVTIVLVGAGTWRRKHVDWEIASSIRDTKKNSRTGLLGVLLPSYSTCGINCSAERHAASGQLYTPCSISPRLHDNIECGFAKIYGWPSSATELRRWIDEAFKRRSLSHPLPNNRREGFKNNRSEDQKHWQ